MGKLGRIAKDVLYSSSTCLVILKHCDKVCFFIGLGHGSIISLITLLCNLGGLHSATMLQCRTISLLAWLFTCFETDLYWLSLPGCICVTFAPIFPPKQASCGLRNSDGARCYMNSLVQALCACSIITTVVDDAIDMRNDDALNDLLQLEEQVQVQQKRSTRH